MCGHSPKHTHTLTHTHTHTHTHAQPWYAHTQAHARALSHTPTLRTVQHARALASISTCRINSIVAALRAYDFGKPVCLNMPYLPLIFCFSNKTVVILLDRLGILHHLLAIETRRLQVSLQKAKTRAALSPMIPTLPCRPWSQCLGFCVMG